MRLILRRMESLGGLMVASDEEVELDRVKIGRGTDQDVQLPDMRVTLAHAEIRPLGSGWRIECRSENPVWVNGRQVLEGEIKGEVKTPILTYVPKPGVHYPGPPPPVPNTPESRAGGAGRTDRRGNAPGEGEEEETP